MTLLIVFNDGTERRIENVHSYEYAKGTGCFQYSLFNSSLVGYIPKEGLKFIGPEEFWIEPRKAIDWDEIIRSVEVMKYVNAARGSYREGANDALDNVTQYLRKLRDGSGL